MEVDFSMNMRIRKVDPGTFSFLEPGWFIFHALAITGMIMIGMAIERRD